MEGGADVEFRTLTETATKDDSDHNADERTVYVYSFGSDTVRVNWETKNHT